MNLSKCDLNIVRTNPTRIYTPVVTDEIVWTTSRYGNPGKLEFTVVKPNKDDLLAFNEGDGVQLKVDGKNVFWGWVFTKSRNKEDHISIVAYDQLRYFKNKDSYTYTKKTAADVLRMIAKDFRLTLGTIENTRYSIPSRVEDNQTLFDIIQNALDETIMSTGKMYVLYDDFGKLMLKDCESMKIPYLICDSSAEDFDYETSIDGETYNKIKLVYSDSESGISKIYVAQDSDNMARWGTLQYYDTIDSPDIGVNKVKSLLELYNRKTRKLTISNALGDLRVRAGCIIPINLYLGDIIANQYLMVEEVQHTFKNSDHFMELKLSGSGRFIV